MKKLAVLVLSCVFAHSAFAFPIFDPLANAVSKGGTDYSDASPLKGQSTGTDTWVGVNTAQSGGIITLNPYTFTNYGPGTALGAPTGTEAAQVNAPGSGTGQGVR